MKRARGYIASGVINGSRTPQHIQNQIIRNFCQSKNFEYVLSRAEYWLNGNVSCQLWAAVREEYPIIVLFSLWQLPEKRSERNSLIMTAINKGKELYFACENEHIRDEEDCKIIEELFLISQTINKIESDCETEIQTYLKQE